jgi:hypothetical protein
MFSCSLFEGGFKMKNDRGIEENLPRVYVCTYCKKEFASIGSVFSHMSDEHEFVHKSK